VRGQRDPPRTVQRLLQADTAAVVAGPVAASLGAGKAPLRRGSRQSSTTMDLVMVAFRSGGMLPLPHGTAATDWVTGAVDPVKALV
jgi:hypothetical protein